MGKYRDDIKEKTRNMNRQETCAYILTYYWYHMLIIFSIAALVLLFTVHYAFGNKKPVFTCIIVNQETDPVRDREIAEDFAGASGLPAERIRIDSDYNFSYEGLQLEGVNESSYEKFFFQWENEEIDAVILPESFYRHCREMGGRFRVLEEDEIKVLQPFTDEGECTAVILGNDSFMERVSGRKEKLLLAFPSTGKHTEESREFLEYVGGRTENPVQGNVGREENEK